MKKKIIAIGGGEFLDGDTKAIDRRVFEITDKTDAKLLFVPTASSDSTGYYESINRYFTDIGFRKVDPLYIIGKDYSTSDLRKKVFQYDAVYVGGGNTKLMISEWKRVGLDLVLKEAWEQGVVMSGISAGSICWFSYGNSDSDIIAGISDKLTKVNGLGYIKAFHCPHYDTQSFRQQEFIRMLDEQPEVIGIALDDCAALEVVDDKYKIITSKSTAKGYKILSQSGKIISKEISQTDTYEDLPTLLKK